MISAPDDFSIRDAHLSSSGPTNYDEHEGPKSQLIATTVTTVLKYQLWQENSLYYGFAAIERPHK